MSGRSWAAVHLKWLNALAYRRLSPAARGALLHVLLLGATTTPEATWATRAELDELMELEGFAPETVNELIVRGWLAETEEGVLIPSWDEIQMPASAEILRRYERQRKADWRWRRRNDPPPEEVSPNNPFPKEPEARQEVEESKRSPGLSRTVPDNGPCPVCGGGFSPIEERVVLPNGQGEVHRPCQYLLSRGAA